MYIYIYIYTHTHTHTYIYTGAVHQLLACTQECEHIKKILLKGNDVKDDVKGNRALQKLNQLLDARQNMSTVHIQ